MTINILAIDFKNKAVKNDQASAMELFRYYSTYANIPQTQISGHVDDYAVADLPVDWVGRLVRFHDDVFTTDDLIVVLEGYEMESAEHLQGTRELVLARVALMFQVKDPMQWQLSLIGGTHVIIIKAIGPQIDKVVIGEV